MTINVGDTYTEGRDAGKQSTCVVTRTNEKSVWYDWVVDGRVVTNFRVSHATWAKDAARA
jgi:hypothetical protein